MIHVSHPASIPLKHAKRKVYAADGARGRVAILPTSGRSV